jgi:hypothetical protein
MDSSKGSVVVGEEGAGGSGLVGGLVVPDAGGEGEEALEDSGPDAVGGTAAVAFEVELGFEGLVDRLDDLAERLEESLQGSGLFAFEGRADEGDAGVGEFVSKVARR